MKLQLHKLEISTSYITEQPYSLKVLSENKEIKQPVKTITEITENLKESLNTQRDDNSVISSCDSSLSTRK